MKSFCIFLFSFLLFSFVWIDQSASAQESGDIPTVTTKLGEKYDRAIPEIMEKYGIHTIGVGVIKAGNLAWTGYYGEQAPGVPASSTTLFNVASITKTITAEAILRMVEEGIFDLDDSMAEYWVDPDLVDDPRHAILSPRMALNHSIGFLNWRYLDAERKLRFINEPGTTFEYSGEGFEYVMQYAAKRLETHPEKLVQKYVFDPFGMKEVAYVAHESNFGRIARPRDESGKIYDPYCYPNGRCNGDGYYSAADDMVINVEDYAKFLIAVMNDVGLGEKLVTDRNTVQMIKPAEFQIVNCETDTGQVCPKAQGYGLGWEVLDYGHTKFLSHGGSDWSELTLGYFYTKSKDGLILFFNGPNAQAVRAMYDSLQLLDPDSPMIGGYGRWIDYLDAEESQ